MMREAVAHLLTREIPEDLARELQSWRRPGQGKGEGHVQEMEGEPIPFQLVKRIHEQLQKMPMGGSLCGHLVQQTQNYGWVYLLQRMPNCRHVWAPMGGCGLLQEHNSLGPSLFPCILFDCLQCDQKTGDREGLGMRLTIFSSNLCVTS